AGATGVSDSVLISVQDAASQTWPAPQIHDSTGAPVTSWSPVRPGTTQANTANFVLRDTRLRIGDSVMPFWRVAGNADQAIPPINVSVAGEAQGAIPAPILAASLGKTAEVFYAANQSGVVRPVSEVLSLQVLAFTSEQLVAPSVAQASGSPAVLDLNAFAGDATVVAVPWPLMTTGQTYWLRARGTLDDGTTRSEELAMGAAVTAAQVNSGLHINLPRSFLLRLENTLPLTLELKVGMGKSVSESEAVIFPEGVLNMTQLTLVLPAPTVENETNGHLDPAAIPNTGVKITTPVYGGVEAGQWVGLEWTAVDDAGSITLPAREVLAHDSLEFVVPKATALLSAGKAVSVAYTARRVSGGLVQTSTPRAFEVSAGDPGTGPVSEGFEGFAHGPISLPIQLASSCVIDAAHNNYRAVIGSDSDGAPYVTGNYLEVSSLSNNTFSIFFDPPVNYFKFGLYQKGSGARNVIFSVYEGNSMVAQSEVIDEYYWLTFQAGSGLNKITYAFLQIPIGNTPVRLDNLTIRRV
ncbi:hypothetical protein IFT75_21260, partial [Pseudomonas sp. CFBP 8758]|uniref:hypothetical protein n=1 Tax=Pseudomonas sp. CFBP 8758 TaxID=2775286 RepID=UPI00177E26FC